MVGHVIGSVFGVARNVFLAGKMVGRPRFQPGGVGVGGTPIYKLYGYVPHFRVWFSSCFSLK